MVLLVISFVWRHFVFFDTPISSKSPSVDSPSPSLPDIILPPSLFPSSSSPLNFITFVQKGIYCPTKVIAPLMEWASYATDSLKPCRIFLAHIKCLLLKSRLHFWTLYICLSSSSSYSSSPFSSPVKLIIFRCLKRCLNMGLPVRLSLVRLIGLRTLAFSNGMVEAHNVIR